MHDNGRGCRYCSVYSSQGSSVATCPIQSSSLVLTSSSSNEEAASSSTEASPSLVDIASGSLGPWNTPSTRDFAAKNAAPNCTRLRRMLAALPGRGTTIARSSAAMEASGASGKAVEASVYGSGFEDSCGHSGRRCSDFILVEPGRSACWPPCRAQHHHSATLGLLLGLGGRSATCTFPWCTSWYLSVACNHPESRQYEVLDPVTAIPSRAA